MVTDCADSACQLTVALCCYHVGRLTLTVWGVQGSGLESELRRSDRRVRVCCSDAVIRDVSCAAAVDFACCWVWGDCLLSTIKTNLNLGEV
jgi:hypothetical protein